MAGRQAGHGRQKGQQKPVLPAAGAAGEPPDQQEQGASLQRNRQSEAEDVHLQDLLEVPDQAVFAVVLPFGQGPRLLARAADRHDAAEDEPVVGEVHQEACAGGEKREDRLAGKRGTSPRSEWCAGRSLLPRPLDEAQRSCRRQRYGDVLQAHPGQGEGYRGQRPLPPRRASREEARGQNEQAEHEQPCRRFHPQKQRA